MPITPTPEQSAIILAAQDRAESLMISAYAGTAKTTTLELVAQALPEGRALALAFNVKIKDELAKRFPANFDVLTLNGLGHRAWGKTIGKRLSVDGNKLGKIVTDAIKRAGLQASSEAWGNLRRLVSAAMHAGLVPDGSPGRSLLPDTKETWEELADDLWIEASDTLLSLARVVLKESIQRSYAGEVSFDDQIYMSALFGGVFPRYPLVMVDEAQDLSPLNHIQVDRVASERLIVVGDARQSIYAFRGADHESMAKLRALRSDWLDLPLTRTFRCPKVVVERQQTHAPGFTPHDTNPVGRFLSWASRKNSERTPWTWESVSGLGAEVFVLCRNNAPLLSFAFKLLRRGIGVKMLGRDIGKNLVALSKRILPLDDTPRVECARLVADWMAAQRELAEVNNRPEKVAGIEDRGESLLSVLESAEGIHNAGDLRRALESLFARDTGRVTLSTGHRAKGLEAEVVLHLDPWRVPSRWAKKAADAGDERQLIQEKNLLYVIETRAKQVLVQANLEDFH